MLKDKDELEEEIEQLKRDIQKYKDFIGQHTSVNRGGFGETPQSKQRVN